MNTPELCPFCGEGVVLLRDGVTVAHACRVLDRELIFPLTAWNTRAVVAVEETAKDTLNIPIKTGYIILPVPDEATRTPFNPQGDITETIRAYARDISRHLEDKIVTESLAINGYVRVASHRAWNIRAERTCKDVGVSGNWECSVCGTSISDTYYFINGYINYCPNCGAKAVE